MDELDRMYRRLVQNVRTGFPDLLGRPFEVAELYTTLIPYRHNRRELELDTNQDYEHALLRLLSGERGYLIGDPQMQTELRSELDAPNPDLSKFRAYSTTMVSLSPDGARTTEPPMLRRPGSGGTAAIPANAPPPPPPPPPVPAAKAAMAERPTLGVPEQAAAPRPPARPTVPAPPPPVSAGMSSIGQRSIVASGELPLLHRSAARRAQHHVLPALWSEPHRPELSGMWHRAGCRVEVLRDVRAVRRPTGGSGRWCRTDDRPLESAAMEEVR